MLPPKQIKIRIKAFSAWLATHKRNRFSEMNQHQSKQTLVYIMHQHFQFSTHMDQRSGTPAHGIHPDTMLGKTRRSGDGIFLSFTWELAARERNEIVALFKFLPSESVMRNT